MNKQLEIENRNIYLSLLRIIAAFLVFFTHVGQKVGFEFSGSFGVQIFFIMSGYLSCISLKKVQNKNNYYKKRILKILPSYYLCLIIILFTNIVLGLLINKNCLEIVDIRFIRYFLFLQEIIPSNDFWLWNNYGALWTMTSFAVFYLCAPYIKKICNNLYKTLIAITAVYIIASLLRGPLINLLSVNNLCDCPELFVNWSPFFQFIYFLFGYLGYYVTNIKKIKEISILYGIAVLVLIIINRGVNYIPSILTLLIINISIIFPLNVKDLILIRVINSLDLDTFLLYLIHPIVLHICSLFIAEDASLNIFTYTFILLLSSLTLSHFLRVYIVNRIESSIRNNI